MTHHDGADNQAKLHLWTEPPTSFSSQCPLTVHPIQVIASFGEVRPGLKSNWKRVLIRGMKSPAYGALPQLLGPLLGRRGLRIRASSCVSHSNSALMFERAGKCLLFVDTWIFYGREMWKYPRSYLSWTSKFLSKLAREKVAFLAN